MELSRTDYDKLSEVDRKTYDIEFADKYVNIFLDVIQENEGVAVGNIQWIMAKEISIKSIDLQLHYNPIPLSNPQHKMDFHNYWNKIKDTIKTL